MKKVFGFLILSLFIGTILNALPPENEERAFVVMGYKTLMDIPNLSTTPPDQRAQVQELITAQIQTRLTALHEAILEWRLKSFFSPCIVSGAGDIRPAVRPKSPTQLLFVTFPIVFEGQKENLAQAIEFLSAKELLGGKFKIEELKENRYALESDFGHWDNAIQDLQVSKIYTAAETDVFPTLEVSLQRREEEYKNLISLYKLSPVYVNHKDIRHMVKFRYVHVGFLNPSWRDEEFVSAKLVVPGDPLADGRIPMIVAIQEDVKEF